MGRTARGVRGIKLDDGHRMISLIIPQNEGGRVLTVSENGYGKRTEMAEFPTKGRGTKGVIAMQTSERNGQLVGAVQVFDGDDADADLQPGHAGAHPRGRDFGAGPQHPGRAM